LDKFDNLLNQVIDEVFRYSLGDINTNIIYEYFEKIGFPLKDISRNNLEFFSQMLRKLLGCGRGQILGSAPILEKAIVKALYIKLGLNPPNFEGPVVFAKEIKKLKEIYNNGKLTLSKQDSTGNRR